MNNFTKRLLSLATAIFMVFSMMPNVSFAADAETETQSETTTDISSLPTDAQTAINKATQVKTDAAAIDFSAGTSHVCPVCGGDAVEWTAITDAMVGTAGYSMANGHYYIAEDITAESSYAVRTPWNATGVVCLHLNGKTVESQSNSGIQKLYGGTLNIMDGAAGTGKVLGKTANYYQGAAIQVNDTNANGNTVVNLYGGTYTKSASGTAGEMIIYIASKGGVVNLYDGAKIDGTGLNFRNDTYAACVGLLGSVMSDVSYKCEFNMYGGQIIGSDQEGSEAKFTGGRAVNIRYDTNNGTAPTGVFNMYAGSITGGTLGSAYTGGSVYLLSGTSANIYGGKISGGKHGTVADDVYVASGATLTVNAYVDAIDAVNAASGSYSAKCRHCDEIVSWTAMNASYTGQVWKSTGHYYFPVGGTTFTGLAGKKSIPNSGGYTLCFNLNGTGVTSDGNVFSVYSKAAGSTNVMGTGTVTGVGTASLGAAFDVLAATNVNIYGGTYTKTDAVGPIAHIGASGGTITLHDGNIGVGTETATAAAAGVLNIASSADGKFIQNGGTVSTAAGASGCAVVVNAAKATYQLNGGTVNGTGAKPVVYVGTDPATFDMQGGSVTNNNDTQPLVLAAYGDINIGPKAVLGTGVSDYAINQWGAATVDLTISGTVNGKAQVQCKNTSASGVVLTGTPNINYLSLAAACTTTIDATGLTVAEDGTKPSIVIQNAASANNNNVITGAFASADAAATAAGYFSIYEGDGSTVVYANADNKLEIGVKPGAKGGYNDALDFGSDGTAWCPACNAYVTWTALSGSSASTQTSSAEKTHFYLTGDYTVSTVAFRAQAANACLHLNGHTLTSTSIAVDANSKTFNIMGQGTITSSFNGNYYGVVQAQAAGTLNILSDLTVTKAAAAEKTPLIHVSGANSVVNINGNATIGTSTTAYNGANSAAITLRNGGTVNMANGTVYGGNNAATDSVSAVGWYTKDGETNVGAFNMTGGVIEACTVEGCDDYAILITTAYTAVTIGENAVIRSAGKAINQWSDAGTVTVSGHITGKVQISNATNGITLSGTPEISNLSLSGAKANATGMTGGSITVTGSGVITTDFADADAATAAMAWFTAGNSDYVLAASGNALALNEKLGAETGITENLDLVGTKAWCPVCESYQIWTAWAGGEITEGGHYYLTGAVTAATTISAEEAVCMHLNGNNITVADAAAINVTSAATLNVMGTGTVTGYASETGTGAAVNATTGIVNLYSGTYTKTDSTAPVVRGTSGTLNLIGATVNDCTANNTSYALVYVTTGAIDVRADAAINANAQAINSWSSAQSITISGTVTGKVTGQVNVILTGAPNVNYITLSADKYIDATGMTGGNVVISSWTTFTTAFASKAAAEALIGNFTLHSGITNREIYVTDDFKLAVRAPLGAQGGYNDALDVNGDSIAWCPACEAYVTWTALSGTGTAMAQTAEGSTHFYLSNDYSYSNVGFRASAVGGCLHLNGHTLTSTGSYAVQASGMNLNIMGQGTISGALNGNYGGAALMAQSAAVVNVYGDITFTKAASAEKSPIIHSTGDNTEVNLEGNVTVGTSTTVYSDAKSAAITLRDGGCVNMNNGTVYAGDNTAGTYAGAVAWYSGAGTFDMQGGVIEACTVEGTDDYAILLSTAEGAVVIGENAVIRSAGNAINQWSSSGTVTVSGHITGKVQISNATNGITLTGTPEISNLSVASGAKADATGMTGGSVTVSDTGVITTAFASADAATAAMAWFNTISEDYVLSVSDNALVISEKIGAQGSYADNLDFAQGVAWCPVCQGYQEWTAWTGGEITVGGHYYLTGAVTAATTISAEEAVCLHLNGNNITVADAAAINVTSAATLNVMGTGTVTGYASETGTGAAVNATTGIVNLYSGTYTKTDSTAPVVRATSGTLNLIGATVNDCTNNDTAYALVYVTTGTIDVRADATINATVKAINSWSSAQSITISGTVTGEVTGQLNITLVGAPEVNYIAMNSGKYIDATGLTGGSVYVKSWTAFTTAFADTAAAEAAMAYFTLVDGVGSAYSIQVTEDFCLKSDITYGAKGGYNDALDFGSDGKAWCPACQAYVTWTALSGSSASTQTSSAEKTHFYLTADYTVSTVAFRAQAANACLHLNGHNLTSTSIAVDANTKTLNIMGQGTITSSQNVNYYGVVQAQGAGTLNILSNLTITKDATVAESKTPLIHATGENSVVNINGNATIGTSTTVYNGGNSAAITLRNGGCVNMNAGTVYTGNNVSSASVGAVTWYGGAGTFNMQGGTIAACTVEGTDDYAIILNTADGAVVIGENAVINAANAINQWSDAGTVTVSGHITGKVQISNATNGITLSGTPEISNLSLSGAKANATGMTGGSITVSTTGTVTTAFADTDAATAAMAWFSAADSNYEVSVSDNALVVAVKKGAQGSYTDDLDFVLTTAWCPACEAYVTWTAWTGGEITEGGHYYLTGAVTAATTVSAEEAVCLHLNGNNITVADAAAINVTSAATLNVMGTGTVTGYASETGTGAAVNATTGTVNLYSGTYTKTDSTAPVVRGTSGTLNLIGATVNDCTANNTSYALVYVTTGAIDVRADATINANAQAINSWSSAQSITISGTVTGKVTGQINITLVGAPDVNYISLNADKYIDATGMTGGSVYVTSWTTFTTAFASQAAAEAAVEYFHLTAATGSGYSVQVTEDFCLKSAVKPGNKGGYNDALDFGSDGTAWCPACQAYVEWTALSGSGSAQTSSAEKTHFYLTGDFSVSGVAVRATSANACLHLNGHTLTSTSIAVDANGKTLNIMGQGIITSSQNVNYYGVVQAQAAGTLNILSNLTITKDATVAESKTPLIHATGANSVVNINGNATIGTSTTVYNGGNSAAITLRNGGCVNMNAGTVYAGNNVSSASVGAVTWYGGAGTFNMQGGTIEACTVEGTDDYAIILNTADGAVVIGENAVIRSAGNAINQWSSAGTLTVSGHVTGKVQVSSTTNGITLSGTPEISNLSLSNAKANATGMTGGSITVTGSGVITTDFASADAATAAMAWFTAAESGYELAVSGNALALNEKLGEKGSYTDNLVFVSGKAWCPVCEAYTTWTAWTGGEITEGGHYYLTDAVTAATTVSAEDAVCLHLNGNNITVAGAAAINVTSAATLNVMGTGTVTGYSSATGTGAAVNATTGIVNLYSGIYTKTDSTAPVVRGTSGTLNLIGATVNDCTANNTSYALVYVTTGAIDVRANATINANAQAINCWSSAQSITISGTVTGKVTGQVNVILTGAPTVNYIAMNSEKYIDATGMTGGNVCVASWVTFTTAFASKAAAEALVENFTLHSSITNREVYVTDDFKLGVQIPLGEKGGVNDALDVNSANTAWCPVCEAYVTWTALSGSGTSVQTSSDTKTHFYLTDDYTVSTVAFRAQAANACLHLNGHNLTSTSIAVDANTKTFNIMGQGTISSSANNNWHGVVQAQAAGTLNILSNLTVTKDAAAEKTPLIHATGANSVVNINGNATIGTSTTVYNGNNSAAITLRNGGTVNMNNGTVYGGNNAATGSVSAVGWYTKDGETNVGAFNMTGGTIEACTVEGCDDYAILITTAYTAVTIGENAVIRSAGNAINQWSDAGTVTVSGHVTGKIQISNTTNGITLSGTPELTYLALSSGVVADVNGVTGGNVTVSASGVISTVITANAETIATYFSTYVGGRYKVVANDDSKLEIVEAQNVIVDEEGNESWFVDSSEAVEEAITSGSTLTVTGDGQTFDVAVPNEQNLKVDLAGKTDVAFTGSGTLTLIDSATKVNSETAGTIVLAGQVTVSKDIVVAPEVQMPNSKGKVLERYVTLVENETDTTVTYSSHYLQMKVTNVVLNVAEGALYYTASFRCDDALAKRVVDFGISFSLENMPHIIPADGHEVGLTDTHISMMDYGYEFTGNGKALTTYIYNIVDESLNDEAEIKKRAETLIYANPFISIDITGDASVESFIQDMNAVEHKGETGFTGTGYCLWDLLDYYDQRYNQLKEAQKTALLEFCEKMKLTQVFGFTNIVPTAQAVASVSTDEEEGE